MKTKDTQKMLPSADSIEYLKDKKLVCVYVCVAARPVCTLCPRMRPSACICPSCLY